MDTMKAMYLSLAFLAVMILLNKLVSIKMRKPRTREFRERNYNASQFKASEDAENYKGLYMRRYLLTVNEKSQYDRLQNTAEKLRLKLFSKVRLADIVEPIKGAKNWQTLFYKIQAKHVDFLMCDRSMRPICVIEIDDNSHDRYDRQQRDKFVDFILQDVGVPTIRKRGIIGSELEQEITKLMR